MNLEKMNSSGNVSESMKKACTVITIDELKDIISKKKEGDISILVTGDLHVASRSVDNSKIIDSINKITQSSILKYTDSLIVNGDFLDRRISMASEEASDFISLSLGILSRCKRHNVSFDLLEGTPSHDNRQPAILTLFDKYMREDDKFPLRYIDRVSIVDLLPHKQEFMKKHYGRVLKSLFIPDEVSTDSQVTWGMVKEMLSMNVLDSVDMSYMHGTFRYQEPMFTEKSHVEENYESITNGRVVINHWHLPSSKGEKIRAPGSLERLRHGEEETKGFYYCILSPGMDGSIDVDEYFVINEDAVIFKTVDVSKMTLSEVYSFLDYVSDNFPTSKIRLQLSRLDQLYPSISEIKGRYKNLKVTEKVVDSHTETSIDFDNVSTDSTFSIRPDNICELILNKVEDSSEDVKENIGKILGEPIDVAGSDN